MLIRGVDVPIDEELMSWHLSSPPHTIRTIVSMIRFNSLLLSGPPKHLALGASLFANV